MRLDDFDPNINVGSQENRGGGLGGFGGGGGGGGLLFNLLPLIGSRFGCGGIVVVLILMVVFSGGLGSVLGGGTTTSAPQTRSAPASAGGGSGGGAAQICSADPARRAACNAFSSAQHTWEGLLGARFRAPSLQFFDQNGQSGCGAAQAAMGPFYCPTDQGIYLDTSFFNELTTRFHAAGDFAQYYVVAHEFGHHIQNLMGTSDRVQQMQRSSGRAEGNAASVRLELQADCYAGVWAAQNRNRLDPGDIEEGMTAAQSIGDDTLQREAGGNVNQESFTHGSSAQRMHWLKVGLDSGDPNQCDTFSGTP